MSKPNFQKNGNNFLFNGKELQLSFSTDDLPWLYNYDYGARMYNSRFPHWLTLDSKAEKYYSVSPYAYAANNPVSNIDLDGKDWVKNDTTGVYSWMDDVDSKDHTPKGYTYVGADNNDILSDMGLSNLYKEYSKWSPYLSLGSEIPGSPNTRAGAIVEALLLAMEGIVGMQGEGYIRFSALSGFDNNQITKTNSMGRVFNGLQIAAIMNQIEGEGSNIARAGNFAISLSNGTSYSIPMFPQNGSNSLQLPNTYSMGSTMYLPTNYLTSPIVGANLSGASNSNSIIMGGKLNIDFIFK